MPFVIWALLILSGIQRKYNLKKTALLLCQSMGMHYKDEETRADVLTEIF